MKIDGMRIEALIAALAGAALAAGTAAAAPGPVRRAGLWESHIVGGPMGAADMTLRTCADPAKEQADVTFGSGRRPAGCAAGPILKPLPGGGWAYHMVCRPSAGMTLDVTGTASGDFQSGYTVKTVTRMTPAPMPQLAESRMTITSRWLGPCPAGMKPGDSTMNGRALPGARR